MIEYEDHGEPPLPLGEKHPDDFSRVFKAVRTHPLLSNVKRIRILDGYGTLAPHQHARIAREAARLFQFVSSLEELILHVEDPQLDLSLFSDSPKFQVPSQPHASP
jgi:hypothetical protein